MFESLPAGFPLAMSVATLFFATLVHATLGFGTALVAMPILVLIFTLWLGWLPGGGWEGGKIQFLIMPVIALSTSFMASIARISSVA